MGWLQNAGLIETKILDSCIENEYRYLENRGFSGPNKEKEFEVFKQIVESHSEEVQVKFSGFSRSC